MSPRSLSILIALFSAAWVVGCQQKAPAPKAADHAAHDHSAHDHAAHDHAGHLPAKPAGAADAQAPAGPRVETDTFLLEVTSPDADLSVGKEGALAIAIEGRGDWHVNQEYPIRIDLEADPGAGLRQTKLEKGDAKEFNEEKATFLASLEPVETGKHAVNCNVSFALCTEENCVLERRTVAMHVKVE
ncbi:MAG: hypothetical protein AAGF92_23130 [Myxococcota bacterium]